MILALTLAWATEATVTVPLSALEALQAQPAPIAPSVRLGAATWTGVVDATSGAVALDASLVVDLRGEGFKQVPLMGIGAVLQEATVDGQPIAVGVDGSSHVWTTDRTEPVVVRMRGWVPPAGQRGSVEVDLAIPETPSTRLVLTLPQPNLRPQVDDAVRTDVRSESGKTVLTADLKPTTRLHVLGLRDLQSEEGRPAALYAETSHLVAIDDHRVDVFAVVRYSILYAGARRFDVFVPNGLTVLDADGEGAFQYTLAAVDGGQLLRGETQHPIRNRYEISLRLSADLPAGAATLPLPSARGVEREQGWVGLEVPGRVRVTEVTGAGLDPLQIQQLPTEVREASLSPILEAWRLNGPGQLQWTAAPLPEVEVSSERVDQVVASTVMAAGGRLVTELTLTLQNRSRHSVHLTLPPGTTLSSASRDGQPVVPAASDAGVVLPLRRTDGAPQVLRVVLAGEAPAPGLWGTSTFTLPRFDLPLAAVRWDVRLPEGHRWGPLDSNVRSQTRVGSGSWLADTPQGGGMDVPSQLIEPEAGERRVYERFWVDGGAELTVWVHHSAPWLRALMALAGLGAAAGVAAWGWTRRARPIEGVAHVDP